jgi:predicted DNA-binding transcriptional regulator YafY
VWIAQQIKQQKDGSGVINTELNKKEIPYIANFFWGLGTDAMVEEPKEAVQRIKKKLKEMTELYL